MPITHLLIINRNIRFSVRMKQSLEQYGGFQVSPFTSPDTALDHLRFQSFDVVMVDFTLPNVSGEQLVGRIRALKPDIAVIATPDLPDVAVKALELKLDGVVDVPCTMRELLPVLQKALSRSRDALPETMAAPPMKDDSDTVMLEPIDESGSPPESEPALPPPDFSSLDSVLFRVGGLDVPPKTETLKLDIARRADEGGLESRNIEVVLTDKLNRLIEKLHEDPTKSNQQEVEESVSVFKQLAAEEPPMPELEESGTVGDLRIMLENTNKQEIAAYLSAAEAEAAAQETSPSERLGIIEPDEAARKPDPSPAQKPDQDEDDEDGEGNTAQYILQTTLDETTPMTLTDLLEALDRGFPKNAKRIKPLPSWRRDEERYIREPDFLEEANYENPLAPLNKLPKRDPSPLDDVLPPYEFEQSEAEALSDKHGRTVESPEPNDEEERPVVELPPYEFENAEAVDEAEFDLSQYTEEDGIRIDEPEIDQITIGTESADPQIAELALSLTQASLDLTSEAALLTLRDDLVAYAGTLPVEDIESIQMSIARDWKAEEGEARIRFITLEGSGDDYMLYSRRTEGGYTLTLVFLGNMPLRVIRKQSDRLIAALGAVPAPALIEDPDDEINALPQQALSLDELEAIADAEEESALQSTSQIEAIQHILDTPAETKDEDEHSPEGDAGEDGEPTPEPAEVVLSGPKTPFTYLWLIRDPESPLTAPIARAIVDELDVQLTKKGWNITGLNVYEDYVYLMADVPGEALPNEVMGDLKLRSAKIAQAADASVDIDSLWADSYCVLTPGRELHQEEIQRFINFSRMN